MGNTTSIKLLLVFAVTFSLASLPGAISNHFMLPSVPLGHAVTSPSQAWYPSGPQMDTFIVNIYQDSPSEFKDLTAATPAIDLSDWRLDPGTQTTIGSNSAYYVTPSITEHGYDELQFMMDNSYWGINMNFGNDPNGLAVRQGVAHLIDINALVEKQPTWSTACAALDPNGFSKCAIESPLPKGSAYHGTTVTTPDPCHWDLLFSETCGTVPYTVGTNPAVPEPVSLPYRLSPASGIGCTLTGGVPTGNCAFPWQRGFGDSDFKAAAKHIGIALNNTYNVGATPTIFVEDANGVLHPETPAGVAAPWPAGVTGTNGGKGVQVFTRSDDPPRFDLGTGLAQELCGIFTGVMSSGCTGFIEYKTGTITSFPGFFTSTTGVTQNWWIYTAAFGSVFPFDSSIFFGYNSRLVSGVPAIQIKNGGLCSNASFPSPAAGDYEYVCNASYDAASQSVEFAPDLATAFSAGTSALNTFGQNEFTVPIATPSDQFGYLSDWNTGVINGDGAGIPNTFTWLNAWTSTPATGTVGCPTSAPLCIRQGFKQPTRSLNPYTATTVWDAYILGNVYDTLNAENPSNSGQLMDWMTYSSTELPNSALGYGQCAAGQHPSATFSCYPSGTVDNFRFQLRTDLYWHDGRPVTGWDVEYSYATGLANGAFFYGGLAPVVCGSTSTCSEGVTVPITGGIRASNIVDVHLSEKGPFTPIGISTDLILPGRYYSSTCGITSANNPVTSGTTTWDTDVAGGFVPDSCMTTNDASSSFDPVAAGIFIGSGPWVCKNLSTSVVGNGCTSSGTGTPPPVAGAITLTRFGVGHVPGSSRTDSYMRSNGNQALDIWTGFTGDQTNDGRVESQFSVCFGHTPAQPLGTNTGPTPGTGCGHWEQGIGANGGPLIIGVIQNGIMNRFIYLNWLSPFNTSTNQLTNLVTFPPAVLYEGQYTMRSSSNGCTSAYTSSGIGGYDC